MENETSETTAIVKKVNPECLPHRMRQNVFLLWADARIDQSRRSCQHILERLYSQVDDVMLFTQGEACVKFLKNIHDEKVLILTSGSLGQILVPQIHGMEQVDTIYIFCRDRTFHQQWASEWSKIKGVYTQIDLICQSLQEAIKQSNEDLTSISFVHTSDSDTSSTDLNRLEPSFMYTRIFKTILLKMTHDYHQTRHHLAETCRMIYAENPSQLTVIDEFDQTYHPSKAIWWYTRECFTYQMLNRALRLLEGDVIVDMGSFLHDLHCQLAQLHREQLVQYGNKPFLLFRGQGLSTEDFAKLQQNHGRIMAFNSFLSTSKVRSVSLKFAQGSAKKNNMVGLLFVMTIDPKIMSTPFANIKDQSYFHNEAEVLFSMHSIFRIGDIHNLEKEKNLYEVDLILTNDDDPQLALLTDRIQTEIHGKAGWTQLGQLLIKLKQVNKAEELFLSLLQQKPTQIDEAEYCYQLGWIKDDQSNYKDAVRYYQRAISIREKILAPTDLHLASTYDNLGMVYNTMGEHSTALHYCTKAVRIRQKVLPVDSTDLSLSYNNIGLVYYTMGEYQKALSYYSKSLDIDQKKLPSTHPTLAICYNNIALVYDKMEDYPKALLVYDKVLNIQERSLPADHPDLARSYTNTGSIHCKMANYSKALFYTKKALEIGEKTLSADHCELATSYNNMGSIHWKRREFPEALSYYKKALDIWQKTLPAEHSLLATCYNNLGLVYNDMGDFSQALTYIRKAIAIKENIPESDQLELATSYSNIAVVCKRTKDYSTALSYYYKALEIWEKILPPDHSMLSMTNNNIGGIFLLMREFDTALSFFQKALDILRRSVPRDDATIQNTLKYIDLANRKVII